MVQGCFGPVNVFRKWYGIHLYIRLNVFGDGYTKIKTFVLYYINSTTVGTRKQCRKISPTTSDEKQFENCDWFEVGRNCFQDNHSIRNFGNPV